MTGPAHGGYPRCQRNLIKSRAPPVPGPPRRPSLSASTDLLFTPTSNMEAQKAFDSPRRQKRGTAADLRVKLNSSLASGTHGLSAKA
jgi:hypothetical protein